MAKKVTYRIDVEFREDVDHMAGTIALLASGVFDEAHPDRWREGMTALAEHVARFVREAKPDEDEVPGLRLIQGDEDP